MLTAFIVLIVISACLAIKPLRTALGGLVALFLFLLPVAWFCFWVYVAYHFIHKYW